MQYHNRQEKQLQMNDKPVIKDDNKIYRVQNPVRNELSLSVIFLFKSHIARSVKKTAAAHPQTNIIFGKVGGSWWKPEYHIIVGGKTKKTVQAAAEMLQKAFNGGK
ncbi:MULTISPECIES: hypothetical protein [Sporomusa]|jgi:hypothetical protein|uniref:hypothetical protein n=1 Tax=Sporomusa TaxID=2375 RepID=UPI00202F18E1|nr:hypothetical protein [Sporomusa sphaeroides]MCM0760741.1 hypothetical protein [Sporomusa sphaeroides DSM 2875]HML32281.1 hypothetical protein [Sporomusa sphaeroides]